MYVPGTKYEVRSTQEQNQRCPSTLVLGIKMISRTALEVLRTSFEHFLPYPTLAFTIFDHFQSLYPFK